MLKPPRDHRYRFFHQHKVDHNPLVMADMPMRDARPVPMIRLPVGRWRETQSNRHPTFVNKDPGEV